MAGDGNGSNPAFLLLPILVAAKTIKKVIMKKSLQNETSQPSKQAAAA
jgi:hypothetical protein